MPKPSPACYPGLTGQRCRGWPSGYPAPSSCRCRSSRMMPWYRRHAAARSCSAAGLSSPPGCRWRRRDPPAPRRCSLSRLPQTQDDPAACSASSSSAAAQRLCRLRCGTFRAGGGKSRPGSRRRFALRPGRPGLSSATAASGRSWQWSRPLPQSRWTAGGTLRSESRPDRHRLTPRGSARRWRSRSPADR